MSDMSDLFENDNQPNFFFQKYSLEISVIQILEEREKKISRIGGVKKN